MKKVLAALAASGVLVAGGFVAAAVSTPTSAAAQEQTDEAPETIDRPDKAAILDEVFAELVADGVISQDQADAVRAALEAKRDELREQFGDRRGHGHRHGHRSEIRALLEDGVIDADELAGLPDGHPLTDPEGPFAGALEDGQITVEELEELRGEFRSERRGFRGFGGGEGADA